MSFVAFLLACIEFVLVGFGVNFPVDVPLENMAFGLTLVALGLCIGPAMVVYQGHKSG